MSGKINTGQENNIPMAIKRRGSYPPSKTNARTKDVLMETLSTLSSEGSSEPDLQRGWVRMIILRMHHWIRISPCTLISSHTCQLEVNGRPFSMPFRVGLWERLFYPVRMTSRVLGKLRKRTQEQQHSIQEELQKTLFETTKVLEAKLAEGEAEMETRLSSYQRSFDQWQVKNKEELQRLRDLYTEIKVIIRIGWEMRVHSGVQLIYGGHLNAM